MGALTNLATSVVDQYGPAAGVLGLASGFVFLVARAITSNDEQLKPAQEENRRLRRRLLRLERDRAALVDALNDAGIPVPPEVFADDASS